MLLLFRGQGFSLSFFSLFCWTHLCVVRQSFQQFPSYPAIMCRLLLHTFASKFTKNKQRTWVEGPLTVVSIFNTTACSAHTLIHPLHNAIICPSACPRSRIPSLRTDLLIMARLLLTIIYDLVHTVQVNFTYGPGSIVPLLHYCTPMVSCRCVFSTITFVSFVN